MRVYISGAISGREPNEVRKEFELAKMYLRHEGYEAISPLANGLPWDCPWEEQYEGGLAIATGVPEDSNATELEGEPRSDAGGVYSDCVGNGSDLFGT